MTPCTQPPWTHLGSREPLLCLSAACSLTQLPTEQAFSSKRQVAHILTQTWMTVAAAPALLPAAYKNFPFAVSSPWRLLSIFISSRGAHISSNLHPNAPASQSQRVSELVGSQRDCFTVFTTHETWGEMLGLCGHCCFPRTEYCASHQWCLLTGH